MDFDDRFHWMATAAIVFVIVATIYATKAFITTILLSVFVAYLMIPVYSNLFRITKNKQLASLLSISIVVVIVITFIIYVINAMMTEVSSLSGSQYALHTVVSDSFDTITDVVKRYAPNLAAQYSDQIRPLLTAPAGSIVPKLLPYVTEILSNLASKTPILLAQSGVAILLIYYLLIDGRSVVDKILVLLPENAVTPLFLGELNAIYNSLFNVYFITCALIGVTATTGFIVMEIPYPFLWGMAVFIFALIPLIGAGSIYIPMSLYYLLIQDYTRSVTLLVFGLIFLTIIPENIVRPHLAERSASIHPAITLVAFAAPLFVVGMMGLIVGPALYGFLLAVYRTDLRIKEAEAAGLDYDQVYLEKMDDAKDDGYASLSFIGSLRRLWARAIAILNRLIRGKP
ncbi:AI-2E family transporter [archaeon]|nr:MAG: AI-2E family transporter [archaeon]